jgi:type I restriction enzyme S subunit
VSEGNGLPNGWVWTTLSRVAAINPRLDTSEIPDSTLVSFVPMAAVGAGTGSIDTSTLRQLGEVKRGYTSFQEGDVLFAKITPCMENGKSAVAKSLSSKTGFGSTEFHVLRPYKGIDPQLLYYYVAQESFRQTARASMTGSAGQLRVPATFLADAPYPLAPTHEQHRIVAAIEQQFTRLDAGIAALRQARAKLKRYRASVLKAAVEGKLTEAWRAEHPATEPASVLLERILKERRAKWEEDLRAKGKDLAKVRYIEPAAPNAERLQELPEQWCWATLEQLITYLRNGLPQKPDTSPPGHRILRINAVRPMSVDLDEVRYLPLSEQKVKGYFLDDGDILFTRYNGSLELLGVAGMVRSCSQPTLHPDKLIRIKTVLAGLLSSYVEIASNVGTSRAYLESKARTTAGQTGISGSDIKQIPIPLPPLFEQEQIVAEVEQRLSVVSELEAAVEANLKRAERLRQSILREAFAGRLVSQDPDDEPASVLLERIRGERKGRTAGNGRYVSVSEPGKIDAKRVQQEELWEDVER